MMSWETPKLNWAAADNPGPGDFNRIEKNIAFLLMQQPILVEAHSGSFSCNKNTWHTLFTYTVSIPSGLSFPIKVFSSGPNVSLDVTTYYDSDLVSISTRVLIDSQVVDAISGASTSGNYVGTMEVKFQTDYNYETFEGTYNSPAQWLTNSYRY
jgi:hypothetical protein